MNWRRGFLLAGVNLAAAVPMIVLLQARDAKYLRETSAMAARGFASRRAHLDRAELPRLMTVQEEPTTVTFNPCTAWVHYPVQIEVVSLGNIPASTLAGWRLACRSKWSLSGWLQGTVEGAPAKQDLALQRRVDVGLCVLIAIQWLFIGGFPLTKRLRRWREPGAFITTSTAIAALLAMIPAIEGLASFPALLAGLAWFWWFGLVIWKCIRLASRPLVKLRSKGAPA